MDNDHGIAGELRRFITDPLLGYASQSQHIERLTAIADRIDIAHKHAIGYVDDRDPETMAENGWVKLPVDADGEYIHIGDWLTNKQHNGRFLVEAIGGNTKNKMYVVYFRCDNGSLGFHYANQCRHHHELTVEDVLRDFGVDIAHALDADPDATVPEATIAKYAAKLRLAGDEQ